MNRALVIWVLGDGKPGHLNQSLGLTEAIGRLRAVQVHRIPLENAGGLLGRLRHATRTAKALPQPDLVIGAGHKTHAALLWLAHHYDAASVVLMKPSLPAAWFDLCLVPEHDLENRDLPGNGIATVGALNRVAPADDQAKSGGILLLGGPSGTHDWDTASIVDAAARIAAESPVQPWHTTDSRRSPNDLLEKLAAAAPHIERFPHQQTPPDWLPDQLARAEEVWVSEDSVSMIYEALSSGARVGLLPVPLRGEATRVSRGIAKLASDGWVTCYADWKGGALPAPPRVLREADRCAALVLEKLPL